MVEVKSEIPFVDWLSFSIDNKKESFDWIKLFGEKSRDLKKGAFGYTDAFFTNNGSLVAFSPAKPQNKLHVSLSSSALKAIGDDKISIQKIISEAIELNGNFTRIDLAQDDFSDRLDLPLIYQKLEKGEINTRLRNFSEYRGNQENTALRSNKLGKEINNTGFTIYIGNLKQGRVVVRIYDKQAQTKKDYSWKRVEFQLRHQASDQYCNPNPKKIKFESKTGEIITPLSFSERSFPKTAYYYLKFLEPTYRKTKIGNLFYLEELHKRHWEISPFWMDFLRVGEGQEIGLPKYESGLEELKNWWTRSMSGLDFLLEEIASEERSLIRSTVGAEKFRNNKRYIKFYNEAKEGKQDEENRRESYQLQEDY